MPGKILKLAWKKKQAQRARQSKRFQKSQKPTVYKPQTKKKDFLEALKGTGGVYLSIARNLGVARATVVSLLRRPDWADIHDLWVDEVENGRDEAEECIRYAMRQRLDLPTAASTARWYLSKIRRDIFGDDKELTIRGGSEPIRVAHVNIPVEALTLPIEVKRAILEAVEKREDGEKQRLLEQKVG